MICLPFPQGADSPCRFPVREHNTPSEKQSPEVAFGNTGFLVATPTHLVDFIEYYFFTTVHVAKLKHRPKNPTHAQLVEIKG
ncbi:MAG: hypothetical protein D9V46_09225 [Deltaproteobacteria bacterium]|uniref:hypothetical protein n=1 Tax=Hydrosulfovibrio ferrireducens TaxID=2934181 RepID=UPI0011FCDDA5|nr:MAG: hypothetical protein D9V46_09225 [Deltaproteobacteria bacterium]